MRHIVSVSVGLSLLAIVAVGAQRSGPARLRAGAGKADITPKQSELPSAITFSHAQLSSTTAAHVR
jgi:hypothetical protein